MLSINDLTYRIGGQVLLDDVQLQLPDGHRAALIGRNGSGKSTLFKLILGESQSDGGTIRISNGMKIISVAQEVPGGDQTPLEFLLASDIERTELLHQTENFEDPNLLADVYERLIQIDAYNAEGRATAILKGLGFSEEQQAQPLSSFSGGFRMRVALAAALFQTPDLLMLDEPTNHLDLEATLWLKEFLQKYPHSLLLISHDRDLLNSTINTIFHLQKGKLTKYSGNYDFYERTSQQQMAFSAAYNEKIETQRKHMQSFVDRFKSKASKSKQAQSRMKAIAKLQTVNIVLNDPSIKISFPDVEPLAPPLINYDKVSLGYEKNTVLHHLSGRIDPDDRIALLGANGNGKSTFAKLLASQLKPLSGTFTTPPKMRIGYFHQHQLETLMLKETAYNHLQNLMPTANETAIRTQLGCFGFSRDKANVAVGSLSGGEKARLVFSMITAVRPHILILDEPTNHLDIEMRESLIYAINEFQGAVILITHDWHLLTHTVDRLWVVANKTIKPHLGTLDDYRNEIIEANQSKKKK